MTRLLVYLFVVGPLSLCYAQQNAAPQDVQLSQATIGRLQSIQDPLRRLQMYRKYYSRDSAKAAKLKRQKLKKRLDSLERLERAEGDSLGKKNRRATWLARFFNLSARQKLFGTSSIIPGAGIAAQRFKVPNTGATDGNLSGAKGDLGKAGDLYRSLGQDTSLVRKDTAALFRMFGHRDPAAVNLAPVYYDRDWKNISKAALAFQGQGLTVDSTKIPYANDLGKSRLSDSILLRQLEKSLFKFQAGNFGGGMAQGQLDKVRAQFNDVTGQQKQYMSQLQKLNDSSSIKDKLSALSLKSLQGDSRLMGNVQTQMAKLMGKYSYVPNSNDLSTAVKRTSLKGRTFKERLIVGPNFQLMSLRPVIVDLSLLCGYKFNSKFVFGTGLSYRQAFGSVPATAAAASNNNMSPTVFSYKAFTSYDVVKSFFAYTEFDRSMLPQQQGETNLYTWQNNWLIGAGRRLALHKKIDMTVIALYDVFHRPGDPVYPKPFTVRIGFQVSEAGMLKPKVYKP